MRSFSTNAGRSVLPVVLSALLLAALSASLTLPVGAATLLVCPNGGEYATIQAAVDSAGPGDVIAICSGAYLENVDLAKMGSQGGSGQGDITLLGAGTVSIAPLKGSALFLGSDFTGDIVLDHLAVTSRDNHAIFFGRTIYGSLTISGSSIADAGGAGLFAANVTEGAVISGTSFAGNSGPGALVSTQLAGGGCPVSGQASQSAGVTAIAITGSSAEGNNGSGFLLQSAYGDIVVSGSRAGSNGGDGFDLSIADLCAGSTVFVNGSRAEDNGSDLRGSGFLLAAPNARVADTVARHNTYDGIEQEFGDARAGSSVWALEVMSSTAADNGRHGIRAGSVHFVTITAASAISNRFDGILIPFTPLIEPSARRGQVVAATFDQHVAISGSLVISNGVGIELFQEEIRAAAGAGAAAAAARNISSDISSNIICANDSAGVFAWGNTDPHYGAFANYWGSFTGPYHAAKNGGGMGNAVIDSTSGGGAGDVTFAPWVDGGSVEIMPPIGIAGAQQSVTVTFRAGGGWGLRGGPGDPRGGPILVAATDNGEVATAYGTGPAAPTAMDADGVITAVLTPAASGVAMITLSGPCGLYAAQAVPVAAPGLLIAKNPPLQAVVSGGSAPFQVAITNTGDITLTNVVMSDPLTPACTGTASDIYPGDSLVYSCEQEGVTASYTNQITVRADAATDPPTPITATASAQVVVVNPQLSAVKSVGLDPNACAPAGPLTAPISSSLYYCITLLNTGEVTLTNHLITDTLLGIEGAAISYPLAPGGSVPITRSLVPQLGPVLMTGTLTNVATVTSIGQVSEIGGAPVPTIGVRAESAGTVSASPQPTGLEEEPEPVDVTRWLYLPAVGR